MGVVDLPLLVVLTPRVLLIANPASRRGGQLERAALRAFRVAGASCDVARTERSGHAAEIARSRGRDYDVVFTLGGDGTAMEVAGALAWSGIPIGVLAGGTGNLLGRALGIPRAVGRAIPALLQGSIRQIDLGVVLGHRFAVAAGVGIDSAMVQETPRWMKRRLGVLAYTIMATKAALRAVVRGKYFQVRVEADGEVIERRAAAVMFANFGAILEDRISFGPDIAVDDGVLDCCIFSPSDLNDAMRIMWRVTRRDFRPDRSILYKKGTRFRVTTDPVLTLQADGELLGPTPADITVEPLAAHLLVPRR
ncbi:MAG: diacylglycerol kinase family lipid kinase [Gemmatimonadaceae bacterium]|nr:diacylglycerol kinase family lipid kinase [Gemmatimonadaceae bacterium]NUO94658.1 diacylglycerol kinase family lipid kinase [Gemmatimonadaceae bacterium]NUP55172.1 diacylglycerol kinase family lipid kinase [Gemmatimonadaceae bacterium]NUR35862.1 diacylglycerol kinase family lipid kinase [Gemmatimonadaceae bacterium]NUS31480.1 diacylglycerol kinase family lipid kinase [Gemmatimonadaceae bacterium]